MFSEFGRGIRARIPLFAFAVATVLIEVFYFEYMLGRGMLDKLVQIPIGGWQAPFSVALSLALGNALFLVSLWQTLFTRTAYLGLSSDRRIRRIVYSLRMVRSAALILAPFTSLLFLPYILESVWYIDWSSGVANSAPFLRDGINGFYLWAYGLSSMDAPTRFIISQVVASFGTLILVGLIFWRIRGPRGFSGIVRRKGGR